MFLQNLVAASIFKKCDYRKTELGKGIYNQNVTKRDKIALSDDP